MEKNKEERQIEGLAQELKKEAKKLHADFDNLKSGGFIKERQKDFFTVRLKVPGGRLSLERMAKIASVASKYSSADYVHLSFRQSVELVHINIKDFDNLVRDLKEIGQEVASCGPRVRVPTACSGCEYNPNGITDTQGFVVKVDKQFFGTSTPHKFKISFSGCPIDCARTREMDLGFQGEVEPDWTESTCTGCRLCAKACQEGAIVADSQTGKPIFYPSKCIYCGDCIKVCPTESWRSKKIGHCVRVGGKHGRHPREAYTLAHLISDAKVIPIIEKTIEWYKANGKSRERIGLTIDRVGLDKYKEFMRDSWGNK